MKILIVTDTYPPHVNGAAYFTYRLAQGLARHSQTVLVIAPSRSWRNETCQTAPVAIFGVRSLPLSINNMRLALPFLAHRSIASVVRHFQPDIIHTQSHFWLSRAVVHHARKNNIPIIGTNHFMPDNLTHYLHLPLTIESRLKAKLWQQCSTFFRSVDTVTTPTKTAAALLAQHGLSKPIRVISNGIDLQQFNPTLSTQVLTRKYQLPRKPIVLTVGRLDKEKNIDTIIHAVALATQQIDLHLIIAGSNKGGEARRLRQLVRQLNLDDSVTFTGFIPARDLPSLYCCAQLFVMAGTAELQSIATMEAMASGLPILAANAVALPELVTPGNNGFLFEPNNCQQLSQQLVLSLADPALLQRMGSASRRRIQAHTLDAVIQQFIHLYTQLCQPHQ